MSVEVVLLGDRMARLMFLCGELHGTSRDQELSADKLEDILTEAEAFCKELRSHLKRHLRHRVYPAPDRRAGGDRRRSERHAVSSAPGSKHAPQGQTSTEN